MNDINTEITETFLRYIKPLSKKGAIKPTITGMAAIKKSILPEHGKTLTEIQDENVKAMKNATPLKK